MAAAVLWSGERTGVKADVEPEAEGEDLVLTARPLLLEELAVMAGTAWCG